MTFGNHEFDFGLDNLLLRIKQAKFPLRSASVRRTATGELVTPSPVIYLQLGDVRAAIIPLTTPETKVESAAKNVAGLDFEEPADTLRRLLPEVRPRADFLIALNHLGLEADRKLAQDVPELDVIIGGHSHDALSQPERVGQTLICQAGSYGQYLGQLDAFVEGGAVGKYRGFLRAVDQRTRPEPRVAAVVNRYAAQLEAKMAVVVGETTVPLEGNRQIIRTQETNLGNLVADAMREYAQADLTLTNAGGIRASIDAGPITVGEVLTVLPFDNEIFSVELTGAQILGVLQRLAALPKEDGGFLQVSGLSFTLGGGQVSDVQVGGRPLEADKVYRVATIDFLITGGNGYTAFTAGRNARGLKATPSQAFTAYLKAHRPVAPAVEGRIRPGQ
jgi:2',3'-cyclic-nucleotide 2'-phosphodiesterase (5'-nucleotidase family)